MFNQIKKYTAAPLPFQGQKRAFISEYAKALQKFPHNSIYIDLFGGSGLLSHVVKYVHPEAQVIWNDYDNFNQRLEAINDTNKLLASIKPLVDHLGTKHRIDEHTKSKIIKVIIDHQHQYSYVDFITLSGSILFSGKYGHCLEDFKSPSTQLYNRVRKTSLNATGYLTGVDRVQMDFIKLYDQYKDHPDVIFVLDPPYLTTEVGSYSNQYWRLKDYLNILEVIDNQRYIYFSSGKSNIIELMEWFEKTTLSGNPFNGSEIRKRINHINKDSNYEDLMLFKYQ